MDWGDEPRKKIAALMKARRDSGATNDPGNNVQCSQYPQYLIKKHQVREVEQFHGQIRMFLACQ